jgi:hypothetical protein
MHSVYEFLTKHGVHKPRPLHSDFTYDRERAYRLALDLRQDGRTLGHIATALSHAGLRPLKAAKYSISAVQDLLRGSIYYNTHTAGGLALHLRQEGYPLRIICDKLLKAGFTAPRGGQWYPKTVTDLMKAEQQRLMAEGRNPTDSPKKAA